MEWNLSYGRGCPHGGSGRTTIDFKLGHNPTAMLAYVLCGAGRGQDGRLTCR